MYSLLSYVFILKTVLGIALHGEWLEALNTYVSHICAVLIFYVTISTLAAMHRFVNHKAPLGIILIADAFLLVPLLMNPIVKTHQIRVKALEKLSHDILRSSIFSTSSYFRDRTVFYSQRRSTYFTLP